MRGARIGNEVGGWGGGGVQKELFIGYNGRAQELCESGDGRPGLPSLINLRFLWT